MFLFSSSFLSLLKGWLRRFCANRAWVFSSLCSDILRTDLSLSLPWGAGGVRKGGVTAANQMLWKVSNTHRLATPLFMEQMLLFLHSVGHPDVSDCGLSTTSGHDDIHTHRSYRRRKRHRDKKQHRVPARETFQARNFNFALLEMTFEGVRTRNHTGLRTSLDGKLHWLQVFEHTFMNTYLTPVGEHQTLHSLPVSKVCWFP